MLTRHKLTHSLMLIALILALAWIALWLIPQSSNAAQTPFRRKANLNLKGNLVMIGNTLQHCNPDDTSDQCTPGENNRQPQKYVVLSEDKLNPSIFDSGGASLAMPVGAKVAWARLYWSATLDRNSRSDQQQGAAPARCGDPSRSGNECTEGPKLRDKVLFSYPGSGGYVELQGQLLDMDRRYVYLSYADVTERLRDVTGNGGLQEYRVANVQAALGIQRHANWNLIIAYSDPTSSKIRNMIVYDGYNRVDGDTGGNDGDEYDEDYEFTMNGFKTASSAPVAKFWAYASQGDNHLQPDSLRIGGSAVGDSNNYFKGRYTDINDNFPNTTHRPPYPRTVATDIQRSDVPNGAFAAGATSVKIKASSSNSGKDAVYFGVFALVNELDTPNVTLAKSASPAGSVNQNDEITYTITATNTGNDAANNVVIIDPIPAFTEYVPGSGGTYIPQQNNDSSRVQFNAGNLAAGASVTVSFKVKAIGCGNTSNQATADFVAASSGVACRVQSNLVAHTINGCVPPPELRINKESRYLDGPLLKKGDRIEYIITITNVGQSQARFVVLGDGIPANTTYVPNSLKILEGANAGSKTDCHIEGCGIPDQAYFHSTSTFPSTTFSPHVVFHLGEGATACYGGALAALGSPDNSTKVSFQVRVNQNAPDGFCIENGAYAFFEAVKYGFSFDPIGSNYCNGQPVPSPAPDGLPVKGSNSPVTRDCLPVGADLAVTKTAPVAACVSDLVTYSIAVANNGPAADPNVVVQDTLPENVVLQSLPPGCTQSGRVVSCGLGPMNSGETRNLSLIVIPQAAAVGTISNEVCVSGQSSDPVLGNNCDTADTRIYPNADLSLAYSVSKPVACPSDIVAFTATVINNGPLPLDAGSPATLTVTMPTGTIVQLPLPAGCAQDAGIITCSTDALGVGASQQFVFSVGFAVSALDQVLTSSASLTYRCDTTPANNQASATVTPRLCTDLSITKSDAPDPVVAGNNLTYTLNVGNAGPSSAANVVVIDALPPGTTFVSVASSDPGFVCSNANNTVTCTKAVFAVSASATITIVVKVNSDVSAGTILTNDATIDGSIFDTNPTNNRASATTPTTTLVSTDADLTIAKSDNPDPVIAGGNLTYRITVANPGQSDARSVVLIDLLPNSPSNAVTFVSATGTGVFAAAGACTLVGKVLTCTATPGGILKAGETAHLDVVVKVNPNLIAGANLTNTATVNWTDTDPDPDTATATATTQVLRECDLMMTMSDSPQAVIAGNDVIYTIKVTNKGPSGLNPGEYEVRQAVFPPAQTTLVGSLSAPGFDCDGGASFPCLNTTQLAPGAMAMITYRVKVNPNFAPIPGFVTNSARVALAGEAFRAGDAALKTAGKAAAQQLGVVDPDQTNNVAVLNTAVGPNADLQLTKTAAPVSVVAGLSSSIITYTINYQNSGPSNANAVVVSDTVSANLIPSGVIAAPGLSCNGATAAAGVQFTCTPNANAFGANAAGVLPAGAGGTLTFQARVPASVPSGALITNGATIASTGASATPDPNTANNTQQPTSTLVTTTADLSITNVDAPDPVTAGNNLTYTLNVANAGPSEAASVVVTDNLPANLTFVSSTSSDPGFACTVSNNKVTCTKTALAASASATITIVGKVKAETPNGALLTNTAIIASDSADPNNANNSANATTRVAADATVTIAQADNPDPVVAGTNFSYRLSIASIGPSDARDVILTDILPNAPANAITFVSVTGTGIFAPAGVCSQASGILICDATGASLKAGETAHIDIVLKVNADVPAGTVLSNTATVNWTDGVPDADTATAVEATTVKHESDLTIAKEAPTDAGAGQRFDYRLTVRSNGPSDVLGGAAAGTMMVVDTLPAGVAPVLPLASPNVTVSGPGGFTCGYDAAVNRLTCRNAAGASGNFAAGSVLTIIFKVQVASSASDGSSLNNCATVSLTAPETDPVSGNNQACASTTIRPTADLSIGKTAQPVSPVPGSNPSAVRAGENIRYTISFGNAGPSDALNVKLTDNVPGNTALVTASFPPTVTAAGGAFTGANAVKLACGHNAATNVITCMPMGNAGLTPPLADGVLPAGVSGTLIYEAKVNASVTGGTIVSNEANIASAANGSTTGTPDPNTANNTSLPTSTPVSTGSQLTISSIVQSAVTQASNPNRVGPVNPASPSGTLAAPGTATTGAAALPGTELTYRLIVTNAGPSDIANIQVVDLLPQGVTYVAANQVDGNATFTCFNTGGAVTCNAPLLPAPQTGVGNSATFDVIVRIDPAARNALVNNARANGTTNGFNQPVGSATQLTTTLQAVSDLAINKTHTPEPVIAGNNLMYTVRAQNFGPSTAMAVQITDTLPAGQSFVSAEALFPAPLPGQPPAMTCSGTTTVTCTGTAAGGLALAPNDFVTIRLTVRVDACTNPGAYVNNVTVTSSSALAAPPRNTATDTVNVIARSDLAITKTAPATVISGSTMTYTIEAVNNGPSCAQDVMISDALPMGTVFIAATSSAGGVAAAGNPAVGAGGTVKFTWAGLTTPMTKRTLTILVRVCSEVLCDAALANTATVSYAPRIPNPLPPAPLTDPPFQAPGDWDKDPVAANNSATANTTAQAQSDLAIAKTGPAIARPGQTITYTLTFANAGPSNAAGTMLIDTLPKGFTVVGQPVSTAPNTTFQVTTSGGVTTVKATLGVIGSTSQCATAQPTTGTITINVRVPDKHPVIVVTNTATISTANCLADPNLANNAATFSTSIEQAGETGIGFPALSEISDQKAGSILFFPIYTSDAVNSNQQNTRISITNISATEQACVHLFAVDGATCAVLDLFVCLTPNQTSAFQLSDLDPGNSGFMMAMAVECETGLPMAFNCLIGEEYVKFASGHQANLGAEAVSATMMFPAGTDANAPIATLKFDGMSYNRLPRVLAADNIPSPADGNATMLIINRIGGNMATSSATIGNVTGLLIDDTETSYSFTLNQGVCQYRKVLDNTFPRTLTPFTRVLPAGRSGWMKFWAFEDRALFGAMVNFNATAASNPGAYNQGHNLRKLTLTDSTTLIVPIFIPSC